MAATDYATVAEVIAYGGGDFAGVDAGVAASIVDVVTHDMMDAGAWGARLHSGHLNLAAHWLSVAIDSAGSAGAVTARTVDKVSESYATVGGTSDAEFGGTKYGRIYLSLRGRLTPAISHGETSRGWEASGGGL